MATIRPPSPLGCIKGIAFRELLRWYREERNPADLRVAIARLPAGQPTGFFHYAPLTDLQPSTTYWFVLVSDGSVSREYHCVV